VHGATLQARGHTALGSCQQGHPNESDDRKRDADIAGRPVAVGLFMDLKRSNHNDLTFCLWFSVVVNWLPIVDGRTAGKLLLGLGLPPKASSPVTGRVMFEKSFRTRGIRQLLERGGTA
jgi:hypothetical protein